MEYECGPLSLCSQDKNRMMDFLSDVFEFEVDFLGDSVRRGPIHLKLFESRPEDFKSSNQRPESIIFSFTVNSENELKEIQSKLNFFLYRKSHSYDIYEKYEFLEDKDKKVLTVFDIDHRLWRFYLNIPVKEN